MAGVYAAKEAELLAQGVDVDLGFEDDSTSDTATNFLQSMIPNQLYSIVNPYVRFFISSLLVLVFFL